MIDRTVKSETFSHATIMPQTGGGQVVELEKILDYSGCRPANGVGEHVAVGEFQGTAGGQTASQPGDSQVGLAEAVGDQERGAIPFEVGVGGHDQFTNGTGVDARDQGIDGQLFGSHPGEGREAAEQDVVDAVEGASLFQGHEVARLFDHADGGLIAAGVAANRAQRLVRLGQVETDLAVSDLLLGGTNGLGELKCLLAGHFKR